MNSIKTSFSIRDLENLSGIKAHTIRIWEKRYGLLNPDRTGTNIRNYKLEDLQKILNISYLNNNGFKISKIAKFSTNEISSLVNKLVDESSSANLVLNEFKLAMITFDQFLFNKTYKKLLETNSFEDIFEKVLIPFLNDIGLLWQTDTITPAHEHFISCLIQQKMQAGIENLNFSPREKESEMFVLFLPENEMHDLGLMYINYQLLKNGNNTIYLGQSIPMENLLHFQQYFNKIYYLSYFTVKPDVNKLGDYLNEFSKMLLQKKDHELWILGKKLTEIKKSTLPSQINTFFSIEDVKNYISSMNNQNNKIA